jgi:hypothetical protein
MLRLDIIEVLVIFKKVESIFENSTHQAWAIARVKLGEKSIYIYIPSTFLHDITPNGLELLNDQKDHKMKVWPSA